MEKIAALYHEKIYQPNKENLFINSDTLNNHT